MSYDLIITNGRVIDGAGNPWFKADVGIKDGRVQTVGHIPTKDAELIDATGKIVSPGFIDLHTHSDWTLLVDPLGQSKIRQGVTTEVLGQCGSSAAPITDATAEHFEKTMAPNILEHVDITWRTMAEYLQHYETVELGINVVPQVGFGVIRTNVLHYENRAPTSEELEQMKGFVREAMEAGAFGMSTGLIYTPQPYAKPDEIIELAKVVREFGGVYASHIRGESDTLLDSVAEAIDTGRQSGCPVHIAHFKVGGKANWGMTAKSCEMVEAARAEGLDVTVDQYPYTAGATGLSATLPDWAHEGGLEKMLGRLRDPETREKIKKDFETGLPGWENLVKNAGFDGVRITDFPVDRNLQGKMIADIAQLRGDSDPADTLFNLLLEAGSRVGIVVHMMDEGDVKRVMQQTFMGVGSDAGAVATTGPLAESKPHPRAYGTFVRVLGKYVREEKVLTLQEAIRKMTSFGAQRYGLDDRGLIREGFVGDVVVFDPQAIRDLATFENPHQYAVGVEHVVLNGTVVISHGEHTQAREGQVFRRTTS